MGQDLPVRGRAVHGNGGLQGRVEPAPVLIRALQIQVSGILKFIASLQHREMGDPGIKPDIESVSDLFIVLSLCTKEALSVCFEPGVHPLLFNQSRYFFKQRSGTRMQFL